MTSTKLFFIVALGLCFLAVMAMADGDDDHGNNYDDKHRDNKGPCKGGYWPDAKGCCPKILDGKAYYRDSNKCYPKDVGCGVFYADANGYYPDEKGNYAKDGEDCAHERKCHQHCIRPEHDYHESTSTRKHRTTSTTEECPRETTSTKKHHRTTSTTEECPKETTTTRRETTSTRKHHTTTEECPKETTSTKKHYTTTEECPKETTSTKKHHRTTSEKCDDDKKKQCHGGQWSDDDGCCPRRIGHQWYYRDAHGCYPVERDCGGVYYADAKGCYPDEHGKYREHGEKCPRHRQCKRECDGGKKDEHHYDDKDYDY